jgi:hypothetical protein
MKKHSRSEIKKQNLLKHVDSFYNELNKLTARIGTFEHNIIELKHYIENKYDKEDGEQKSSR